MVVLALNEKEGEIAKLVEEAEELFKQKKYDEARKRYADAHNLSTENGFMISRIKEGIIKLADEHYLK